jgi:hypothetical protein
MNSPAHNRFALWTNAMPQHFSKRAYSAAPDFSTRRNMDTSGADNTAGTRVRSVNLNASRMPLTAEMLQSEHHATASKINCSGV